MMDLDSFPDGLTSDHRIAVRYREPGVQGPSAQAEGYFSLIEERDDEPYLLLIEYLHGTEPLPGAEIALAAIDTIEVLDTGPPSPPYPVDPTEPRWYVLLERPADFDHPVSTPGPCRAAFAAADRAEAERRLPEILTGFPSHARQPDHYVLIEMQPDPWMHPTLRESIRPTPQPFDDPGH
ncbi:hypothetical protein FSW04_24615 [Baekduia soli]|uniref:Uncharacterized protein n=1 Tax=Baekduia soli TaxID=496014 RepID=A0A5B8UCS0_9ACTN|nr:hypothetical protein [Baekduia soli]QEC50452.1 hypothetical protein FSW04_24615 [Baekduia soli]